MSPRALEILKRLIAFDTVSSEPNMALIEYVRELLASKGIESLIVKDETGKKANLFASTGPRDVPGVLLSGHTDVVPAAGQAWTMPPFQATLRDGRIYGRGTCDMKGFIALAIDAMLDAADMTLIRPLQLALSHDEEIGCVGVRRLLDVLHLAPVRPFLCVVGEPTLMQFAVGHKGKASYRTFCRGQEAHSSLAPRAVNAIHLASDFIAELRKSQKQIEQQGARDEGYDIPYSTVHIGRIDGGKALNIVPNLCTMEFEYRNLPGDNPDVLLEQLRERAEVLVREAKQLSGVAAIEIEVMNEYPALETHPSVEAVRMLHAFAEPGTQHIKVSYGTEGGLFAGRLNVPVVVCGPGSIEQAHKPDEFIDESQMDAGERFLRTLLGSLKQ
ncbi:acetylornithine deacetylase [Pseudomonas amygdali pv. tabaci str. ATCC 11528]|uniref:Acetylornithine deacetylase n=2 Tax=Pseudomonas syringae group genomosp. 2 TaxID=251698 RepID=A0A3M6HZN5_PSEAJ|nr:MULTISPECIES: acetylornithine deacetylase [Pseudomonas syringae group]KEZ25329.1 acetylornithine deacetylase [Pseudomonas amygdali pv. tabaci str. 6605]KEZ70045.1 acetylornithine deacetylase [Pseudomonas amygdali pv. tabaci str. ATCC 11528]KKY50635.1 acetylornithine deacetylase [Pseudomonas amygdali pv. tabaci str. ATCC 11528]MDU8646680.1 acetylornithine deacetylase [Pseudomonas syringae group sp. 26L6]QED82277.1 acetylornithine deacetylase [Pseudomonas amygdali pv. tabaci str. ATCC 11528]